MNGNWGNEWRTIEGQPCRLSPVNFNKTGVSWRWDGPRHELMRETSWCHIDDVGVIGPSVTEEGKERNNCCFLNLLLLSLGEFAGYFFYFCILKLLWCKQSNTEWVWYKTHCVSWDSMEELWWRCLSPETLWLWKGILRQNTLQRTLILFYKLYHDLSMCLHICVFTNIYIYVYIVYVCLYRYYYTYGIYYYEIFYIFIVESPQWFTGEQKSLWTVVEVCTNTCYVIKLCWTVSV